MNLFWEVPNRDLTQDDIDGVINVTRNIINESKGCGPGYASYTANNKTFCRKNGKPTGNEHLYYNNKDDNAELTDDHLSCSNWAANGECKKNPGFMFWKCKKSCAAIDSNSYKNTENLIEDSSKNTHNLAAQPVDVPTCLY